MEFKPLFAGKLVRLAAPRSEDNEYFALWSENDEYLRIMDNDPARPITPEAWGEFEASLIASPNGFHFHLRTLADDTLIGSAGLFDIQWMHQVASLGIAISDRAYWGKGYGTDALQIILGYAFRELNLYRVGSTTISYNIRSMKAHEKVGFRQEGVQRSFIQREGKRFDLIQYGILRLEWEALQ
ncbi:MAG: GNAT family N-acetyltransferase [Chlorogloeopsis fritschii C42_A2020_084]|uniref:GNAT family N-acetyltransferase n=1 Tax=Chlorogloeopsis fritschii TaxID=1124 RepID=UPI0019DDACF1|nr:GNAT family protein [Chlorogloeopsis fritschii]MBF2007174.1 GNAT family N-acetyltransferase [Chlorogloeopsis fritschii C42_A2020_084]